VRISLHPTVDLLITLWILGERSGGEEFPDLENGPGWFAGITEKLTRETLADIERIGSGDAWLALITLLPETTEGESVADFIEFLSDYDSADLRQRLIGIHHLIDDEQRELIADAAEGRPGAPHELLTDHEFGGDDRRRWRKALKFLLAMPPRETKEFLVRIVSAVHSDAFARHATEFRDFLEADVAVKQAVAKRVSSRRLIEIATSGEPLSLDTTTRPIVLVPAMVSRPRVVVCEGSEFLVLAYPVPDECLEMDLDAPTRWLVDVHKALGDERRLRVLRRLAVADATLAELAEGVDIAKSTLHHHLALLRAAGLVTVRTDPGKRYTLRRDTLAEAASLLDYYVLGAGERDERES
jgi:DNA-binding transcriptional ArsR family regulator